LRYNVDAFLGLKCQFALRQDSRKVLS